jgi:hypothetical protein
VEFLDAQRLRKAGLSGLFCYSLFGAALTLAAATGAGASPLVVKVEGASMITDPHTHKLALELVIRPASRHAFDQFMTEHRSQKIAILVHGRTTLTTIARQPASSGTMEIAGAPLKAMRKLINQLSMQDAKISIDVAAH